MTRVREVEDGDLESVAELSRSEGWSQPRLEDWQHLWRENPATDGTEPWCRGWVLLDEQRIVGFVANVPQAYMYGQRPLLAATASALVVAPSFRGSSLQLMVAFATQRNVDLLLNTTAAPHVSKISEFLKFKRIPQPDYDRSFYWILRALPFAKAGVRKKGYGSISAPAGLALAPFISVEGMLRGRGVLRDECRAQIRAIAPSAIGEEFDDLWRRRVAEKQRLLAVRDSRTLRWHFSERGRAVAPCLIGAFEGGVLLGYVAVVRQDSPYLGLSRACAADIFVERDDPMLIRILVRRAMMEARNGGAAMLEVIGFPAAIRDALRSMRPFELVNESWPFLYRAREARLHDQLGDASQWFASLFDGDGSL